MQKTNNFQSQKCHFHCRRNIIKIQEKFQATKALLILLMYFIYSHVGNAPNEFKTSKQKSIKLFKIIFIEDLNFK